MKNSTSAIIPRIDAVGGHRRGAVVAQVAVSLTVLIGFAALAVDVSTLYSARTELQRTADAAALAAAADLGDYSQGDPIIRARQTAVDWVTRNKVAQTGVTLASSDVVFGHAAMDKYTKKYVFTPTETWGALAG